MAKRKNHYYILVFTNYGAVYLTGFGEGRTAFWHKEDKPKELSKSYAEDVVFGLNVNGYQAVLVSHPYEIENQPYRYSEGTFEWKWNNEEQAV